MACPVCGFHAAAEFSFCPQCGQRLAVPSTQAEAERRPATVMFADRSGFTTLSEELDPEIMRSLQTELFAEMSATIQGLEGFVEKYLGDAMMAVFGAPIAHDEDPERAVSAALLLHAKTAALSERWLPRTGRPLTLHVGIHSGLVVVGHIRPDPGANYAVTGDTVNTAARLEQLTKEYDCALVISDAVAARAGLDVSAYPGPSLALRKRAQVLSIRVIADVESLPVPPR